MERLGGTHGVEGMEEIGVARSKAILTDLLPIAERK